MFNSNSLITRTKASAKQCISIEYNWIIEFWAASITELIYWLLTIKTAESIYSERLTTQLWLDFDINYFQLTQIWEASIEQLGLKFPLNGY